ncbi:protein of unknown function [Cupriavidus neocaledonicus]|uniref:Uncharacterized protein n=1 Tax=Cupriavidus neocaledonicus TaxID=1040979 RepID=A0A375H8T1_9BURK|nr:protein of unknown function [Cupriavidus neocaledonicus]
MKPSGGPRANPEKNPFFLRDDDAGLRMFKHARTGEQGSANTFGET